MWTTLGWNLGLSSEAMLAYDGYSGENDGDESDNAGSEYEMCLISLIQNDCLKKCY